MCQSLINSRRIIFLFVTLFTACVLAARAQNQAVVSLNADELQNGKSISLSDSAWKYRAGDEPAWAEKDFFDSDWQSITNDQINEDLSSLKNWDGRAWFRQKITIDEQLAGVPLAWRMWQWGATEIYLDGVLIKKYGEILPDSDAEYNPRGMAFPVTFASGGEHTVAVRYSFAAGRDWSGQNWLARGGNLPGFRLVVEIWTKYAQRVENQVREDRIDYTFIGLFFAFALVHFLLFVFYRAAPGNLFYSLFVVGLALSFLLQNLLGSEHFSATGALVTDIARLNVQGLAIIALLAFLYVEFKNRPSKFFWLLLVLWAVTIGLSIVQFWKESTHFLVLLLITFADCLRIMIQALKKRHPGAWIIATGVSVLVFGVIINIAHEREWIDIPVWLYRVNLYIAVFSVPLTVSIYLARNFARTNRHLEARLEQVKELSAQQIEQARQTAELRLAHERTQAENERRAKELEEARQLQLSMLPKKLPVIPNLEIAAYMKPATEVGGDYYDFYVSPDGTLTVAVGDATGHGLKAGTVVTATKSLFNNLADASDISDTLRQISRSLKAMNLRGLFMALTLMKLKDNSLKICAAGMPSTLVYRAATETVEEISIRAVPLGSMTNFNYRGQEIVLQTGDCVVVMSDGFPEMFNAAGEMLGFDKAAEVLREIAAHTPQEIIDRFVEVSQKWAGGRPADDDVTFVVLKIL